ncbi:sugar transferase [Faecalibacterium sp. CLA-AA-H283]|uniref:sugar transferase n=1 Tax=Faecalibacterium TaxID=216851 RepID=UPI001D0F2267|nr:sugar transferase [Faecalibacterium hominis (ex Afrizal et al. 2022)]MCC2140196.1 sugar transferase [Faecalibacterium hominis (ex Afrizal et al. 2022)]
MITKREKLQYGYLFLIDLLSLVLSIGLAWGLTAGVLHKMGDFQLDDLVEACFLLLLAYILTFFTFDQSENIVNRTPIREVEIAVRFNFLLTLIDAACLALTKASMLHSRYFLVFVPVIDVFVMTGAHAALKKMLVRSRYTKGIQSLVGVVTTQENASPILEELKKDWSKRVTGLAILEAAPEQLHTEIDGVKIEANFDNFMDWLRQAALDEVYLDVAQESEENMLPYLEEMESMGLTVHFRLPVLDRIEKACCDETSAVRISRELSRCAGGNVVTMGTVELKLRDQVLKRTMDIVGGIVGCIISIPIIALVAIPLKLESPGPLIFKQRRVGRNGRVFYIHKLRSMYVDAEARKKELMAQNEMNGLMFKMEDDPRITRVGRFIRRTSIDELPQFFDVVRGSMSLVGTRPPTLDEYRQYESHHKRRLSMKPGITGLWQVSGRSDIDDFEEVVKLDVQYIDNWSIWMDIYLLFRTVGVVFDRKGAK